MKNNRKKFYSILITVCILLSCASTPMTVFAANEVAEPVNNETANNIGASDSALKLESLKLSADDVPEQISFESAQEKGHVYRLRSKETDDCTVVFLNNDNTETMYLFAEPIKYTDEYGNKKDKSTALALENGAYTMPENDVLVHFSRDISKGVTLSKDNVNITMSPIPTVATNGKLEASTDSNASLGVLRDNKVAYSSVFDNAELVYTPLYSGFKEDIVLESYSGVSEFSFIVNTNGLCPVKQENGAVWFLDTLTNEPVAKMMQVVCYDSDFNFADGDVRITEIKPNQIYTFTVIADSAFLTDKNTVYPVYVDPTISTISEGEAGIEDTVIYSGKPNSNYGSHKYLNAGYVDSTYKVGYVFYQFPTLSSNSVFSSLESSDVLSATLTVYTASGGSGTEPLLFLQHFGSTWDASTVTYNTMTLSPVATQFTTATVPTSGSAPLQINMSVPISNWLNGISGTTPEKGIYIGNNNSTNANMSRDFLSVEYAMSSSSREQYMPRLEINFNSFSRVVLTNYTTSLYVGETYSCSAKYVVDGIVYAQFNGMNFSFVSSNENVLTTNYEDIFTGFLTGINPGTARVTVSYGSTSTYFDVTVSARSILPGAPSGGYVWNNHVGRACDIDAHFPNQEADENITYSIHSVSGLYLDEFSIDSSTGVLQYNGERNLNDYLIAHPTGTITVKASYFNTNKLIPVKVICDNYNINGSSTTLVPVTEARWLRTNYPIIVSTDQENANNGLLDADATSLRWLREYMTGSTSNNVANYIYNDNYDEDFIGDNSHANIFKLIQNSEVVIIQTHGDPNSFSINAGNGNIKVTTDDILSLHQGYFARCKLIICLFCHGADGSYDATKPNSSSNDPSNMSIVQAFADRGAQCVVGFYDVVQIGDADTFQHHFIAALCDYEYLDGEDIFQKDNSNNPLNFLDTCNTAFEKIATGNKKVTKDTIYAIDGRELDKTTFEENNITKIIMIGEDKYDELL